MRARLAFAALFAIVAGALSITAPVQAQEAPSVTVFQGQGYVCGLAQAGAASRDCTHDLNDPIWTKLVIPEGEVNDGLYWPGVGPAALGPYSLSATGGPDGAPTQFCVSTQGGPGCTLNTTGELYRGEAAVAAGNGAYCGSSHGEGTGTFSGADGSSYSYNLAWVQSAATILPLMGETDQGQTIIGFTSSRGASGSGQSCGAQGPISATTVFQVEGMTIAF